MGYEYDCGCGGYGYDCGCGAYESGGITGGFPLIVVMFILLIIVGACWC